MTSRFIKPMLIGFTGSRKGMRQAQYDSAKLLLTYLFEGAGEFHHGCCVGADSQAHTIVTRHLPKVKVVLHPPENTTLMVNIHGERRKPKPYRERNRAIVDETKILIATPREHKEISFGSGTWSTVRYARTKHKRIYLVMPDGKIKAERVRLPQKEKG